jgi:hypothetical protein
VFNRVRASESTSSTSWAAVANGSGAINWKGRQALVVLSIGQYATAGGAIRYRVVTGSTVLAGGDHWRFFHNTTLEHHAHAFLELVNLPAGKYAVSLEWSVASAGPAAASDGNDNMALTIVPTE